MYCTIKIIQKLVIIEIANKLSLKINFVNEMLLVK